MPAFNPIKVYFMAGRWVVDYGSYVKGFHGSRTEAVLTAECAAQEEGRGLSVQAEIAKPRVGRRVPERAPD